MAIFNGCIACSRRKNRYPTQISRFVTSVSRVRDFSLVLEKGQLDNSLNRLWEIALQRYTHETLGETALVFQALEFGCPAGQPCAFFTADNYNNVGSLKYWKNSFVAERDTV